MEIWKDVVGYEGIYQVSSYGRVKALANPNRATHRTEHLLSQINNRGYKSVALCVDGRMKNFQVHRLVASAFLEKPTGKDFVDHINTVKDDNRVSNLRWCTEKENNNNPITLKHKSDSKKGEKNPNYKKKLPWVTGEWKKKPVKQYSLDGTELNTFPSAIDASITTGITASNINRVCNGIRQTAGGYVWKFETA